MLRVLSFIALILIASLTRNSAGQGIDPFNITEDFNSSCPDDLPAGWTAFSIEGTQTWKCTAYGRSEINPEASEQYGIQINGYSGGPQLNEDWLITPPFDLREFDFPLISFWSRLAYSGPRLRLMVSNNYTGGDPLGQDIIWDELSDRFAKDDVWTYSGAINLADYKTENVRLAFVYNSSPENNAARWTLDDFKLQNSENPPLPNLTTSLGNLDYFHFGIVTEGMASSYTQSFSFSLSDGLEPLTIKCPEGFELSKNGVDFFPSVTYSAKEAEANNEVTIKFNPNEAGAFNGQVHFESGNISKKEAYLTGSTYNHDKTFDVVTWNIEWFGSELPFQGPSNIDLQLQNVKTIIEHLDADVYAFQEITNLNKFYELVEVLPAYHGFHSTAVSTGAGFEVAQKLAFLYKTTTVDSVDTRILLRGVDTGMLMDYPGSPDRFWASGRLPFLFEVKAKLNGIEQNISLINIHARSNGGGESAANSRYAMRRYDVTVLKDTLDEYYSDIPFLLLGDYNDDLDETVSDQSAPTVNTTETSFISYINDTENYIPVTLNLSNARLRTYIDFENVIDHVIISREMRESWIPGSERIVAPFDLVNNYGATTSDHLPVKVRFHLKPTDYYTGVNVDKVNKPMGTKATLSIVKTFPNPVNDKLHVAINSKVEEKAEIIIYNQRMIFLYSRNVGLLQGKNRFELDANAWNNATGLLILKVNTCTQGVHHIKLISQ